MWLLIHAVKGATVIIHSRILLERKVNNLILMMALTVNSIKLVMLQKLRDDEPRLFKSNQSQWMANASQQNV